MSRKKDKDLLEKGKNLVVFYRENPVLAAEDLLNVVLDPSQRLIMRDLWFKKYIIITAGRGTGKTFLNATFACLIALLYPGQRVGLLAPSFRQSKHMFAEVEKIYSKSGILREACARPPTKQSDRCHLTFRQAGTRPASVIEAVPLGTGDKIRGARYYVIITDEFAKMPYEVFNQVVLPMGATAANPMERVKRIALQKELIAKGLAKEGDFEEQSNKIIMTSSAYYTFNHMYKRVQTYKEKVRQGDTGYAEHNISYLDMSDGFMSEDNIAEAKDNSTADQFNMEYGAKWISDSAGIFKASLVERCRRAANHTVKLIGSPGKEYVLGVDPARTRDAFALCLIELGSPCQVVGAWEFFQPKFPEMSEIIMDISKSFNLVDINMDPGGGGLAVKDLLAESARYNNKEKILDAEDEETEFLDGRRILHMIPFSPRTISEMNYGTLNLMEKGHLTLPQQPQLFESSSAHLSELEDIYDTVDTLLDQVLRIEVTESRAGVPHFDLPEGGHGREKKDLYTSFILAAKLAYDRTIAEDDMSDVLQLGIVTPLSSSSNFGLKYRAKERKLADNLEVTTSPVIGWAQRKYFK